jgi:hypothetical protein
VLLSGKWSDQLSIQEKGGKDKREKGDLNHGVHKGHEEQEEIHEEKH